MFIHQMAQKEEAKPSAFTVMLEIYYLRATCIILYILRGYPLPLHSWHPAASCSIRKLCIETIPIYRVPNWMGSLVNHSVLKLAVICVRPEDVEILGEIPSLLFLNLVTTGGTGGRIVFPGNSGFRSLKYFSLRIDKCGTSLEFEAGSMPKLEHVKLEFNAHEMECLNGASSLGMQHLSSLNKAEIEIGSDWHEYDVDYNPVEDDHDDTARCISRAINAAIETLPNRPTASFKIQEVDCKHFESVSSLTKQHALMVLSTSQLLQPHTPLFHLATTTWLCS